MKMDAFLKRHSLPVFALLLALLPLLCSCGLLPPPPADMIQGGAVDNAYRAYNKGDYATALGELSLAEFYGTMSDERHAEILYLKGRCLEGMGHRLEAVSLYEYLIKTFHDTEFAARAKGRLEELRKAP